MGAVLLLAGAAGCDPRPTLTQPLVLQAPFPTDQVWAVVPFVNESGVSTADGTRVADQFVKAIEESDGLSCVALNRTLAAMQILGLRGVSTNADAVRLREALGVDGLVVGTVTLWDPYPPPKMGMAAQVYLRPGLPTMPGAVTWVADQPAAQASGIYDSSNHAVLAALRRFAEARHKPGEPYGEDIYLVDMGRYCEFSSYETLRELLTRLGPPVARPGRSQAGTRPNP